MNQTSVQLAAINPTKLTQPSKLRQSLLLLCRLSAFLFVLVLVIYLAFCAVGAVAVLVPNPTDKSPSYPFAWPMILLSFAWGFGALVLLIPLHATATAVWQSLRAMRLTTSASIVVVFVVSCTYFAGYGVARQCGLFKGDVETFVPYGETPSGLYEIKPIGFLSLGVSRETTSSDLEYDEAVHRLRSDQELSRRLWPYYSWLARCEECLRCF